jgi:hypothetical protein
MMPVAAKFESMDNLRAFLGELEALGARISADTIIEALARSHLRIDDVAPLVTPRLDSYARRRVARTEAYEVLVMTWLPGQGSGPHDHAGSVSAFKILRGTAHETRFALAADSLVDPTSTRELHEGEVGLDAGDVIHAVRNDCSREESLVSIHVYAPPIPELRRRGARGSVSAAADETRASRCNYRGWLFRHHGGCSAAAHGIAVRRSHARCNGRPADLHRGRRGVSNSRYQTSAERARVGHERLARSAG